MKDLKKTAGLGLALGFKLIAGLVTVKICAQYMGPEEFGITGQIGSLVNIVVLLAGGGVSIGLAKIYADGQSTTLARAGWVKAARCIALISAAILIAILLAANPWLRQVVLQDRSDSNWIIGLIILAAIPIAFSGIGQGQNNGRQRADIYAGAMVGGSLLGLAGLWLLSHFYGATGALLGIVWLPSAQALPFLAISRYHSKEFKDIPAPDLSSTELIQKSRYLLSFGILSISAGAVIPAALIAVRLMIERNGDSSALGLWQATTRISEAYTQLPLLLLSVLMFARFAGGSTQPVSQRLLIRTYGSMGGLMALISVFVLALSNHWIDIVFTPAFRGMSDFLPWQLAGDCMRVLSYVGTTVLAARGHVKLCVIGEFLQGSMLVGFSHLFIPGLGVYAPFYAYILTYSIYLVLTGLMVYTKGKEPLVQSNENLQPSA